MNKCHHHTLLLSMSIHLIGTCGKRRTFWHHPVRPHISGGSKCTFLYTSLLDHTDLEPQFGWIYCESPTLPVELTFSSWLPVTMGSLPSPSGSLGRLGLLSLVVICTRISALESCAPRLAAGFMDRQRCELKTWSSTGFHSRGFKQ